MSQNDIVAKYILKFDDLASKGLLRVAGTARMAGMAATAAAAGFVALGAATVAGAGAVIKMADSWSNMVDSLDESATKMGVDRNFLKDLRFGLGQAGVEAGQTDAGLTKFIVTLGKMKAAGGKAAKGVPEALAAQLAGAKDATEANKLALAYLSKIPDQAQRATVAAALYGKAAGPAFAGAVNDMAALNAGMAKSKALTGIITDSQAKMASDFQDSIGQSKTALSALGGIIGAAAVPALKDLSDRFTNFVIANREVIASGAKEFFAKFAAAVKRIDFAKIGKSLTSFIDKLPMLIDLLTKIIEYLPQILTTWIALQAVSFGGGMIKGLGGIAKAASFAKTAMMGIGAVGAVGPQLPLITRLGKGMKSLLPVIGRTAMAFGPWGLALASAGAAAYALYESWDTVGPMIGNAVSQVGDYLMAFADTDWFAAGQNFGDMIANWMGSTDWAAIGTWITTFATKIGAQIAAIDFAAVGANFGLLIANWIANVDWGAVGSTIWSVMGVVGSILAAAVMFIGGLAFKLLTSALGAAWHFVKAAGIAAWEGIKNVATNAIMAIINRIKELINNVKGLVPELNKLPVIGGLFASNEAPKKVNEARGGTGPNKFAMSGEATIRVIGQDGRQIGRATVPMTAGNNRPRTAGGSRG